MQATNRSRHHRWCHRSVLDLFGLYPHDCGLGSHILVISPAGIVQLQGEIITSNRAPELLGGSTGVTSSDQSNSNARQQPPVCEIHMHIVRTAAELVDLLIMRTI
jgi:hypothetical protein